LRRIERRLQVNGLPNVLAYRDFLKEHGEETRPLLRDMLISVTNFFRDREAFDSLERDVIPRLFEQTGGSAQIRAWSVGCATGEEAYSIAMLLADQNALSGKSQPIQVFASDIDEQAINTARRGLYPQSIITDVTPARLRQYFEKEEEHYCVRKSIREKVLFAAHNILHDPSFSKMHLISCRNLLIYLNRDIQKKVFEMMHYALHPGGYLFLGSSESAEAVNDLFTPIDKKHRIYQANRIKLGIYHVAPRTFGASERLMSVKVAKAGAERRQAPAQELHRRFLEEFAPPSVLIDRHADLVYASKSAARFLQYPGGEPSQNILALIHPDLQLELRTALFQATQTHMNIQTRQMHLRLDDHSSSVCIQIRPGQNENAGTGMTLLIFDESTNELDVAQAARHPGENATALHLEEELLHTKEQLRSVIEQYEIALEDSKASNEEFQAINEELRSTTEELETSKEELQSINEELVTVNFDLKMKVDETSKANDDLQNFVAATEIATIFVDRGMHIKRYTKPSASLFNIIATDVGRSIFDITHRLDYPALQADISLVFDKLQPVEREVQRNDGCWYIARLLPYRSADDRIEGLVLTFIDISERKSAQESMRAGEERMRLIAASTKDYAIATMDMEGIITSWNSGAENLFGYAEQEILGQSGAILFTPEDRASGLFETELRLARVDGRAEDDRWHLRKDGTRVFCSGISAPLIDGKVHGFVKIARDLTGSRRMQAEQEARLVQEKRERVRAEEAARLRDEFFAVLSHELKQPLNLIQLTAETLSRLPETAGLPAIARGTATIKRMVDGQAKIIDDLMDLSRLHTGKLSLVRTHVNFTETVAHVVNLMTADAAQKNVQLSLEPPPAAFIIQGDGVRIEQIVWNLLSNAIKFTPAGGTVEVRLWVEKEMVCMEIRDSGRGIAVDFMPLIFDMFRQADVGTARQYGGMGIGLALVKELTNSHGGRVEASSNGPDKGACFRVYLPLAIPLHAAPAQTLTSSPGLDGKRILLIDDATDMLESLAGLLQLNGASVFMAGSAQTALELARAESAPFNLIISDIGMPDMDGHHLLAALREVQSTATTPAIALSGFTRPSDVQMALQAGFETHVCKPVALDQLITAAATLAT
ncbi:MAG: CheR family methyltransferase, partial [Janthinobacterium lividum]